MQRMISMDGVTDSATMYHASLKPKRSFVPLSEKDSVFSKPLFSFIAPSAGMFVWLKLSLEDHPSFSSLGYKALEMKFRTKLRKLVFSSRQVSITPVEVEDDTPGTGNFRIKLQRLDDCSGTADVVEELKWYTRRSVYPQVLYLL
ncbi:hypothetical protein BDP27DRAFT_1495806 [Rhodocollybia butyracea]|uniref:Uncharacterized protein n=1 Tax=Rhodocollybia butyracea TaxID=206335 RepID=A0A9P5TZ29_9AGAR|nr:hypothetical protein BDP27DRAFT_1495806 [Rhodocollybia butyracea]